MRLKLLGPERHDADPVGLVGHNIRVWLDGVERDDVRCVDLHMVVADLITARIEVNVTELEVDCNVLSKLGGDLAAEGWVESTTHEELSDGRRLFIKVDA